MSKRDTATVHLVWVGLQMLAGLGGAYFALLTLATFLPRRRAFRSDPTYPRFAVVVPAHDEERVISNALRSLESIDYPQELYQIFVIADNCSDATAEVARRFSCTVWERIDPERRSKGYALRWAFDRLPERYEAVVIVDADSEVEPELLSEFARVYDGSTPLQGLDLMRPTNSDSATSVATYVASTLHNVLKPWGRENLGCSAGLVSNGVCLPRALLEEVPWVRFGLTEDSEYHLDLVLSGRRVRFVPEAQITEVIPSTFKGMQSQRMRWERGRVETLWRFAVPLLRRATRGRDIKSLEALVSVAAPPFSLTVSAAAGCVTLGLARRSKALLGIGTLGLVASAGATFRGLWLVRAPRRVYSHLFELPLFVLWRNYITLRSLLQRTSQDWLRTERSKEWNS